MDVLNTFSLSALTSSEASLNVNSIELLQHRKSYSGGYSFNFVDAFRNIVDVENLNYSNFYLTQNVLLENYIKYEPITSSITRNIFTYLKVGAEYVSFSKIDPEPYKLNDRVDEALNYGVPIFSQTEDLYNIEILDNEYCKITFTDIDGFNYILAATAEYDTIFIRENKVALESDSNESWKFRYQLDSSYNIIYLTLPLSGASRYMTKSGSKLVMATIDTDNKFGVLAAYINISPSTSIEVDPAINTSFVTYNGDGSGSINLKRSNLNLTSNYLLHKSGDLRENTLDLLCLKNIANSTGNYTSNNSLLSSTNENFQIYAGDNRDYTSILSTIDQEADESLELNYVFANQDILIDRPSVTFTTGESLLPFTAININDTKFVDSGAFSFTSPTIADRVYRYDNDSIDDTNGRYLCTWLSGGIYSDSKIWVDRFYYPDRISKQEALGLVSNPVTGEDLLEQLISANIATETRINKELVFDKVSDMTFIPNTTYRYERVTLDSDIINLDQPLNFCEEYANTPGVGATQLQPTGEYNTICEDIEMENIIFTDVEETTLLSSCIDIPIYKLESAILLDFYKNVNDSGGLNIGFDYAGDDREFTILSDRNEIDGGISIIKSGDTIAFSFQVFEPSTQAVTVYSTEVKYRKNYNSTLMFTFNAYTGRGVLSINGEVVYSFNTFVFGAVSDRILFGNVKVTHDETSAEQHFGIIDETSADILIYTQLGHDRITNIHVSSNRLTPEAVDQLTLSRLRFNIDDITISIPCGMRNSTDRVKLLNSICFNQRSKSNSINVNVKNLGITDPVVLEDIKSNILIGLNEWIPVNTSINNFNFIDFK